ncbi:DUF402 domain-containing protein [Promicromonospora sp. NPDC057488]|uniref:DUF402 domain-containing protein n=1 Tax=Promicromonospora sp. NPDC057488 TaxID=3346147 RepID=UPI00366E59C1
MRRAPTIRDLDFHPDEDHVRCYRVPDPGVLVNDADMYVRQSREPAWGEGAGEQLVLRHLAFSVEWFKINATYDLSGNLIETRPPDGAPFALNCDISTPMVRVGGDVSAVDLFLDVLVSLDGDHRVVDEDEFAQAASAGLISAAEVRAAESGLARLLSWIRTGRLHDLLDGIPSAPVATAPEPLPVERTPLSEVPSVAPGTRRSWSG